MNYGNDGFMMEQPMGTPLVGEKLNAVMRGVYGWMTMGLMITAFVAVLLSTMQFIPSGPLLIGSVILQFGIVIGLGWAISRISATVAGLLFFVYAAITGLTFSILFMAYSGESLVAAFITTSALFGSMTLVGLTTKMDLSKYSTYFMMGLIGLFIAIIVNMFLGSSTLQLIISVFGVILFTALTAYDTQRISQMAADPRMQVNSEETMKFSVLAALTLYLDFINLFIFLLQIFGGFGRD